MTKTIEQIKEEMATLGYNNIYVELQDYHTGNERNSYFNNHECYDEMMSDVDNIEFLFNALEIIRDNHNYRSDVAIDELLDDVDIDINEGVNQELTLDELKIENEILHAELIKSLDELEEEHFNWSDYQLLEQVFDCDYVDEAINNGTYEALGYWTIYFEPKNYDDEEIAILCGLTPFKYNDDFMLALGGCGMDLSPRLDAYIALTSGVVPSDSNFFRDGDYFKYVIGETVYNKIIEECKLSETRIVITCNEELVTDQQLLAID